MSDHKAEVRLAVGIDAAEKNVPKVFYRDKNGDDWQLSNQFNPKNGTLVPIAFSADNAYVYAYSDMDESTRGLVSLNVKTGETQDIYRHPLVDVDNVMLSQSMKLVSARILPDYTKNVPLTDHPLNSWLVELQGYLTLPRGSEVKNLPLIVHSHGGPHGPRDIGRSPQTYRYSPVVAMPHQWALLKSPIYTSAQLALLVFIVCL